MTDEPNKFTHIGIEKKTKQQIAILASVKGVNIYDFVRMMADEAWADALQEGLVTEAIFPKTDAAKVSKKAVTA